MPLESYDAWPIVLKVAEMGECVCNGCISCADIDTDLWCRDCVAGPGGPVLEAADALVKDERHAVVLRLQQRAIQIRTLGKKYRWAADILENEARAIKEGKHRG
jgi:hypothetical protein